LCFAEQLRERELALEELQPRRSTMLDALSVPVTSLAVMSVWCVKREQIDLVAGRGRPTDGGERAEVRLLDALLVVELEHRRRLAAHAVVAADARDVRDALQVAVAEARAREIAEPLIAELHRVAERRREVQVRARGSAAQAPRALERRDLRVALLLAQREVAGEPVARDRRRKRAAAVVEAERVVAAAFRPFSEWNELALSFPIPSFALNTSFDGYVRVSMLSAPPAKLPGMSGANVLWTVRFVTSAAGNRSSGAAGTSGSGLGSGTPLSSVTL
jgi:hypothetical protein